MSTFLRQVVFIGANLLLFVGLRYVALLMGFLGGMGAADHYQYESVLYLPGTALQLLVLGLLYTRSVRYPSAYPYGLALVSLLLLVVLCQLRLIPYEVIPS
ncbi:hypothetical protein GO988_23405 [Hymenobacter sp. HMF4947]|uniref:Uncharacterized protein n=1 Tax=Hymenobacter ginkgonis TaxID=2682976 RepID=A0A7K1TME0_9BACT|nr:hypothetical protein [Hymenobacter ginkgonis]MVN79291.1 hypothetical protein [Hymenobacter ginkgonis]